MTDIGPDHPDDRLGSLLMESVDTESLDSLDALLLQLATMRSPSHEPNERGMKILLLVVRGVELRDRVKAMLAAEMTAMHVASMTVARRSARVETIPQLDSTVPAFNIKQPDSGKPMSPTDFPAD